MYKVVVIEDEDIIRKGLIYNASWQKYDCMVAGEAKNGKEGIEKIKTIEPDIVIVDINMPVLNGLEMLEKTVDTYNYDAIIVSGYSEFEYARKSIRLGVTEYLLKPVNYTELYQALEKITQKRNFEQKLKKDIKQIKIEKTKLNILDDSYTTFENKYVKYMVETVRNSYSSRLSLTDLSTRLNMSCTYLNSKLKSETGYTFIDYLNRYRIKKAIELLKQDKYMIYEISDMVGFKDYKYFVKVFRKYTGSSPSKFNI